MVTAQKNQLALQEPHQTTSQPNHPENSYMDDTGLGYVPDELLITKALESKPLLLEVVSNNEQPAPTVGHVLALYFRLTDELCYRACFNRLSVDFSVDNAWFGEQKFPTLSFMNNYSVVFDRIYRLSVNNELLDKIRNVYETKVVFEKDLNEEHVQGITTSITSLEQAYLYLDGMTSRVFSANFGFILDQYKKQDTEDVFNKINLPHNEKHKLETAIIQIIDSAIFEQSTVVEEPEYAEQGIYAEGENYLLLQSINYLKYAGVFSVSLQQLGLTALTTHLLGIHSENPQVEDIGFHDYNESVLDEPSLQNALLTSSVKAHRYHYPSKVLSTLF